MDAEKGLKLDEVLEPPLFLLQGIGEEQQERTE